MRNKQKSMVSFARYFAISAQFSLFFAVTTLITAAPKAGYATQVPNQRIQSVPYKPLPAQKCQRLQNEAAKALKTSFTITTAAFTNSQLQKKGKACVLKAKGTGKTFQNPTTVMRKLKTAFIGWQENLRFAASGPTGIATGFTRDRSLLLAQVEWEPAAGVKCPTNQPIASCKLKPEQQIYSIVLKAATF